MSFLKRLFKSSDSNEQKPGKSPASVGDPNGILFYVRCKKCGTPVRVRIDRRSDLNPDDGPAMYVARKDIMDSKCFQLIKAEFWIDPTYTLIQSDIRGGTLISEEEYQAAMKPTSN